MTLSAGTRLGPYEILSPLGAGGMGEVYRAKDTRLGRDVAVKVLPAEFSSDASRLMRFEKEARSASALNHPNIVTIYEIGSSGGVAYIAMELVEGETLRTILLRGSVGTTRLLQIATQTAQGLARAHEAGIVHRDLKPENVMVTRDGLVKILDFGLAKPGSKNSNRREASPSPTVTETSPGLVLGTVGYMSPEQARAKTLDFRSDQFTFGSMLYEMATGKGAFQKTTAADTVAAILNEQPEPLEVASPQTPPPLCWLVDRCLAKDPQNRYASTKDLAQDLAHLQLHLSQASGPKARDWEQPRERTRRGLLAAVVVVLLIGAVFLVRASHRTVAEAPTVKRVAVLPFENLGTPEDDYFADGIADEIRTKLTSLPGLDVVARSTSVGYKRTTKTPGQIGHELAARYLLTATVRWQRSGGVSRVHVTPELIELRESGPPASKWQQTFDATLTDVFQVQSDIASRAAQALGVALEARDKELLIEAPTKSLSAYDAFLRGEHENTSLNAKQALAFYEQAVALDPSFAEAWARVSEMNSQTYVAAPTPDMARRALEGAENAVALAPNRAEGYSARGSYQMQVVMDDNRAIDQYNIAHRLAPRNAEILVALGWAEMDAGRSKEAIEHARQAERLDPRLLWIKNVLSSTLLNLRRYGEAREVLDRGLALEPANPGLIVLKAMSFLGEGDLAGARAAIQAAPREIEPTVLVVYFATNLDLGWVLDESHRELLLRLTPSAFDDLKQQWGISLAQASSLKGDTASVQIYSAEARKGFEEELHAAPEGADAQGHGLLGLALAYLGRREEAIREGKRGVALMPEAKHPLRHSYLVGLLARIYTLVGEQEKAIDQIESLVSASYMVSPAWFKIDPNFEPLRENPRFQKLVADNTGSR